MIEFILPFVLAGEFITHVVAIVLIGVLSFEYFLCRYQRCGGIKQKSILLLLAIIVLGAAMMWFEFFIGRGAAWPNGIYVVGLGALLYLAVRFRRTAPRTISGLYSSLFLGAAMAILVLAAVGIFWQHPFLTLSVTVLQVVAVVIFFLHAMAFLIAPADVNGGNTKPAQDNSQSSSP